MAKDQTVRVRPAQLQEDRDAFAALKKVTGYAPQKPEFSIANIQASQDDLVQKREEEVQKETEWDGARDNAVAAEWAFHNAILGAKGQVSAQFGEDSNEIQSLGLKKKSEYKSPSKKAPKPPTT
jgi:DNA-binding GntR family transcriptional regulator